MLSIREVSTHFLTKSFLHVYCEPAIGLLLTALHLNPSHACACTCARVCGGPMGIAILPMLQVRKEKLRDRLDQDCNGWRGRGRCSRSRKGGEWAVKETLSSWQASENRRICFS